MGKLNIRIQKKGQIAVWSNYKDVIKDVYMEIYPGDTVKLDDLFNQQGVTIKDVGEYRVYVFMTNNDGSIIKTKSGPFESSWSFKVVKSKKVIT